MALLISKNELLDLAAILAKRPPTDEMLEVQETPLCWKLQSIHPITKHHTLVAYIYKKPNHVSQIHSTNARSRSVYSVDNSQAAENSRNS